MVKRIFGALIAGAFLFGGCGEANKGLQELMGKSTMAKASHDGNAMFGAIFTTDSQGELVNGNIYDEKEDVYLNGGPKKEGAAGLPDGEYYYLVSDPGCKMELAGPSATAPYDTSGKVITVEDGEFTELMQLAPYDDTPNPGGEYKVHLTAVAHYEPGEGCFGFVPRWSKTDNFKIKAKKGGNGEEPPPVEQDEFCISGYKFYDADRDGEIGSPEVPVKGIEIVIVFPDETTDSTETSTVGQFGFCGLEPGEYEVYEVLPEGWFQTTPANGASHVVTVVDEDVTGLAFGNYCLDESELVSAEPCPIPGVDFFIEPEAE